MKKPSALLALLTLLVFLLGYLVGQLSPLKLKHNPTPQNKAKSKDKSQPPTRAHLALDSALQKGKLPPPRGFVDSKINGALSYTHAMQIASDYHQRKDYEGSLVWVYRAYELAPRDKEVWVLYARNLFALGRKQEALAILEYAKRNLP